MFKKLIEEIRSAILKSQDEVISKLKETVEIERQRSNDLEFKFKELELSVDKKLIEQHKEYSEKLFEILGAFLRWNKEISLVSYLGGKEPDLKKLKIELMRPYVEEGWAKTNAEQADKINKALQSKGEKVRLAWERYKNDLLSAKRENKDSSLIEAKLEILNILMEGMDVSNNNKSSDSVGDNSN